MLRSSPELLRDKVEANTLSSPSEWDSSEVAVSTLPVGLNPVAHGNDLFTTPCVAFSIFWLTSPPPLCFLGLLPG